MSDTLNIRNINNLSFGRQIERLAGKEKWVSLTEKLDETSSRYGTRTTQGYEGYQVQVCYNQNWSTPEPTKNKIMANNEKGLSNKVKFNGQEL